MKSYAMLGLTAGLAVTASAAPLYIPADTVINVATADGGIYDQGPAADGKVTWVSTTTPVVLNGAVWITNGTLEILPGAVVRGQPRSSASATDAGTLVITRTAELIADGSSGSPIILTTAAVNLTPDSAASRASGAAPVFVDANPLTAPLGSQVTKLWGGLLMLGNAPTNIDRNVIADGGIQSFFEDAGTVTTGVNTDDRPTVEGIPVASAASVAGLDRFGGNLPHDNSGIVRYVSIRHSGAALSANNEVQGLTLGGVGSGTTLEYIEIWGSADDGVEIFGGTANLRYLVIVGAEDDTVDLDAGYTGVMQFVLGIGGNLTDRMFEWDGSYQDEVPNGFGTSENVSGVTPGTGAVTATRTPVPAWQLWNGTFIANSAAIATINTAGAGNDDRSQAMNWRDQCSASLYNSIFQISERAIPYFWRVGTRGTEDRFDTIQRIEKGNAGIYGLTYFRAAGVPASLFVLNAAASTRVSTPFGLAVNANVLGNPEFKNVPAAAGDELLPSTLGLNPVPGSSGSAYDASIDTVIAYPGQPNFVTSVGYRGAFDVNPFAPLWTTGWTAAEAYGTIVTLGFE